MNDSITPIGRDVELPGLGMRLVRSEGRQIVVAFPNGYAASIINDGYGSARGYAEFAGLASDDAPTDDHWPLLSSIPLLPYGSDRTVIGWLSPEQVVEILITLGNLPPRVEAITK